MNEDLIHDFSDGRLFELPPTVEKVEKVANAMVRSVADPSLQDSEPLYLFDMPLPAPAAPKPQKGIDRRRASFGRVPQASYLNVDPSLLREGLELEDVKRVNPDFLFNSLFVGERGTTDGTSLAYNGILFREDEFMVLVHNHKSLMRDVTARTLASRALQPLDPRREAASRSAGYAVEGKLRAVAGMIDGYTKERSRLLTLMREMRSPGYAHMSEAALRILVGEVAELSFANMVHVVGIDQQWDQDTQQSAYKAMRFNLWGRNYKKNFQYWGDMTDLALRYNRAKMAVAKHNQHRSQNELDRI